ncbi:MAG: HlyD family efflux transporter periplasmic adaptor subunit [Gemmatimonadetes bacterium]|nr:HlyD family efflux transporter periplasmic adaptor subunit [Gemmatimonadota bacterium]
MDIPREKKSQKGKRILIGTGVVAVLVVGTLALRSLEPAAPKIDRNTIWLDSVQRGPFEISVRGPGTLVPEQIRWITAVTSGRVDSRLLEPGQEVTPETIILEMTNPDVQLESLEAQRQLAAAKASLISLETALETQRLNQIGVVASTKSQYNAAKREAQAADTLVKRNLISGFEAQGAWDTAEEMEARYQVELDRLDLFTRTIDAQLVLQRQQVDRLKAVFEFQRDRVASMKVRAGAYGVLRELPFEIGQWAQSGQTLAVVVEPGRLKAVLRIPETQARDIAIGQNARIDTRNGLIDGQVMRIDPAVQNGTVTVDVRLISELPRGARPDLSVDGTIQIEYLSDVLYVSRPAYGQANSTVGMFKLQDNGEAVRVNVRLGRSSVSTIEVVDGLVEGDLVVVSDMSRWDRFDRVRIQ